MYVTDPLTVYLQRRGGLTVGGRGVSTPTHLRSRITAAGWNSSSGLFTQLWGSAGPGEREDVFRASLIMAAWEEINRAGPAGMLQLLPPVGGGGVVMERARRTRTPGGYTITLAARVHICTAARACKSTFQVWPDASGAPTASARTRGRAPLSAAPLTAPLRPA